MPRASTSSSSQRAPRQSRRDTSEDEDEDDGPGAATQGRGLGDSDLKKKAGILVRTALTLHYAGKVYRRSDMSKIAGGHRNLAPVLAKAQQTLRYTMGMELYEMPAKWKMADQVAVATAQLAAEQSQSQSQNQSQSRAQTQSRSLVQSQSQSARGIITAMRKGKGRARPSGLETLEEEDEEEEEEDEDGDEDEGSGRNGAQSAQLQVEAGATPTKKEKGSQIYVLRSILRLGLQEALSDPAPFPERVAVSTNDPMTTDSGAPLRWEAADASAVGAQALVGIRSVILCLILANGRQMSNEDLLSYFRRLQIKPDTPLPFHSRETPNPQLITFEKYLDLLDRALYLQKIKPSNPGPSAAGPGESANAHAEWRWGQRAYAEFSEKAAAVFIQDLMFDGDDEAATGAGGAPGEGSEDEDEDEDEDGDGDGVSGSSTNRRRSAAGRTQRNDAGNGNGRGRGRDEGEGEVMSVAKRRKKLLKDVEAAAGGELQGEL